MFFQIACFLFFFFAAISLLAQAGTCWLGALPRLPIRGRIINHVV